jgi:hypothetical protein
MPIQDPIYALDLSGNSAANRIVGERIFSNLEQRTRTLVPQFAPFFANSLVVRDSSNGLLLVKGVDYVCTDIVGAASQEAGAEIYRAIVVQSDGSGINYSVDYSTVGGRYLQDFSSVQTVIDNLASDNRPLSWPSVLNRPSTFDPAMHLHSLGEAVGFEYITTALETLTNVIRTGDQAQQDAILLYIDDQINLLRQVIGSTTAGQLAQTLVLAQAAMTRATAAAATAASTQADTVALSAALTNLTTLVQTLVVSADVAEASAVALISQYPAAYSAFGSGSLTLPPSISPTSSITYTPTPNNVTVDTDWYVVNSLGQSVCPQGVLTVPGDQTPMASVTISTQRDAVTGLARLNISLKTFDRRATTLAGQYMNDCVIWLMPPRFEDDVEDPVGISTISNKYALARAPVDQSTTPATFQVVGIDASPVNLTTTTTQALIDKIAAYLLDCRADYNVANYGSIGTRRTVRFALPPGTELNMGFGMNALQAADIERRVSLRFRMQGTIMNGTRVNNVVTNAVVASTLEAGRIRSVSAAF